MHRVHRHCYFNKTKERKSPMSKLKIIFSDEYKEKYADIPFGLAIVKNCIYKKAEHKFNEAKLNTNAYIKKQSGKIEETINLYTEFFKDKGYRCPLGGQFKMALKKGLPQISPYINILLLSELKHGILMGLQDYDAIDGFILIDIAEKGEQFAGMRGTIVCKENEIVLRDKDSIIASFFQGPDKRTEVKKISTNLVLYGFFVPGIEESIVEKALGEAVSLLSVNEKISSELNIEHVL
jgi:DNA/RNA-binding domain of Phe-tRNA-synthetase-like protein